MPRSAFAVIYITVFVDLMGFGIVLPQLPFYLRELGASGVGVGAALTAYSGAQFIAAPFLGRFSDKVGRRPVILVALLGTSVSLTVSGLAGTLWLLILSRTLAGAFGGSVAPAQAYIADSTLPQDRARYMGGIGAAIGLGLIMGPAIGALLSPFGFGTAAFVAAAIAFANFIFGWFRLKESVPSLPNRTPSGASWFRAAITRRNMPALLLATFVLMIAFVGMEATFALIGDDRFGLEPLVLGFILAYVGALVVSVQVMVVGPLSARIGEKRLAMLGALLIAGGLGAIPLSPTLWIAATFLGITAVGQGVLNPGITTLNSLIADQQAQGGALGLQQSVSALARAIGPVLAGALFDLGDAWPYWVGALCALIGFVLIASMRNVPRSRPND